MIDLTKAGVPGGGHDPLRMAHGAIEISRIDEQRFTRGRDDERRVSAFHVDDVDVQRALLRGVESLAQPRLALDDEIESSAIDAPGARPREDETGGVATQVLPRVDAVAAA